MPIYKHPKSPYYHYRFMVDGRRYKGSTGETSPYKARQVESDKMAAVRRGEIPATTRVPRLESFAAEFLKFVRESCEAGHLAVKTRKCYENGCRLLAPTTVWRLRLSQITSEDAATLRFPGSASNANQALRTLRRILSYARAKRLLAVVPTINLREEHGREKIVEPWIEDLLLEFAPSPLREVIVIMLDSFMRPDEVCRMQWGDIYWQDSQVFIPTGKTKRARRFVGLTDRMRNELRIRQQNDADGKGGTKSPWVFPSKRAKSGHLAAPSLDKMWRGTVEKVHAAIRQRRLPPFPDGLVLYSCRHTGATNYLAGVGGNLKKVANVLGHSDTRISEKYLHPSTADAAEIMNRHNRTRLRLVKKESA